MPSADAATTSAAARDAFALSRMSAQELKAHVRARLASQELSSLEARMLRQCDAELERASRVMQAASDLNDLLAPDGVAPVSFRAFVCPDRRQVGLEIITKPQLERILRDTALHAPKGEGLTEVRGQRETDNSTKRDALREPVDLPPTSAAARRAREEEEPGRLRRPGPS